MDELYKNYVWLFHEISDPRIKGWPLMDSPIPVMTILIVYLTTIKVVLPIYMKNRPAYSLKGVIRWFNIFQIIANSILFYGILTSGWLTNLTLGCHIPDHAAQDAESLSMLKWMYLTTMTRIVDMLETSFFVLRKKDNQASFLHIYHHCISFTVMWIGVKYVGGGMSSLTMLINNPVHVIMYSYYLIAAESSPKFRAKMNKWKMWLTVIQMIQFTILFIHCLQALLPSCPAPQVIVWIYIPNVIIIYYLFYDFFKKTYVNAAPVETAPTAKAEINGNVVRKNAKKIK